MNQIYKIIMLVITLTFTACSDKKEDTKATISMKQPVLRVGMELAYPPFEMSTKEGVPAGVSVDMAYALGTYLDRKVIIENIAWDGLIPSLKTNKIDIIISSMTITDERKKVIGFSDGYAKSSLAILANSKSNIATINNLNKAGKTVAVKKGSTGHLYAKDNLKNANVLVFDKESACVLEVVQGKADGFIYDQLTIYKNWSQHKDTTTPILATFQKDFEHWGIALRKDDSELKSSINKFVAQSKKDGTFDKLSYKYLKEARETFDKLNIPFFF